MNGMNDEDKRTELATARLSPREAAAMHQARGEMPKAAWLREAVLEKLAREGAEVADEARRPAPRRLNYRERAKASDGQRKDEGQ